ncbi:Monocarboxylate transporter [Wickerhamomyces ciferrii]|uniref:Monocarboxylate transporter n=1 Tax=Wickerhamomyces ciferrii (strain ATCC 14091 / BCRC 22168 / CBS 111 / JCM 3599 / NBRC 0793 / NRRL Y-1031 F-60-10) TaxID=1206466 RepID=K0KLL7_WICCF|nr:Monocarboxylate transporter [Wickerhamomyces ciferrii]CCH46160.1 Monocarboxylate transporter [Wickerhamomyces ciferrii]
MKDEVLKFPQLTKVKNDYKETTFEGLSPNESAATGSGFTLRRETSGIELENLNNNGTQEVSSSEITIVHEDLEFPEGGLKAYLVVFGSFMGLVPVFGLLNSIGAIQAYVGTHQLADVSSSSLSWIFSINLFIAYFFGIFAGVFFDRNGTRTLLILGSLLFTGGLMATGNCQTVYQFVLALGVVVGLGLGMLISPLVGVVSHYFKKKRATAVSIATIGGSVGGIVMPLMLRSLYPKVGFAWAMRILGFMCMGCFLCSILFARERISTKKELEKEQQADNSDQVTNTLEDNNKPLSSKDLFKIYISDVLDYKSLFEIKFIFCALAIALVESSLIVCSVYYPSYAIKRGFKEETSYLLVTVVNTTSILGRYIPGYIADKFLGRFNVAILTLVGTVLVSFTMWLPFGYSLKVLYAYSALYGFCSGSVLSLSPVCCGQISRTDQFGKRYSTMYLIVSFTMLTAIPIGGAIIGKGSIGNYNNFIIYSGMMNVAGILCYLISRHACVGFKMCKF